MTFRLFLLSILCLFAFMTAYSQKEKEVFVSNEQGKLYGTLTVPKKIKNPPLVILIAGSGPTDRDGNNPFAKNNSLKFLSDALVKNGIATLRYDKQGVGKSNGATKPEVELLFQDYVNDLLLWIDFSKEDARFSSISLAGHSEGSLIALLAAKQRDVKQVISIAGAGRTIDIILEEQISVQDEKLGFEARNIMEKIKRDLDVGEISRDLRPIFRESVRPYIKSWMELDPAAIAGELEIPVVVIHGDKDIQVSSEDAIILHQGAKSGSFHLIKGMNHILKFVEGDLIENRLTYMNMGLPVMEEVVDIVTKVARD